jgi:hypothetical protein
VPVVQTTAVLSGLVLYGLFFLVWSPTRSGRRRARPAERSSNGRFARDDIAVKVVSGDDPRTVAALARQAGLDAGEPVTGAGLDALSDP